jgi:hypothetical protein
MMAGVTEPPWRSRFYLASRKCGTSQLRRFKHAPGMSASPQIADVSLRRSEPPLRANADFRHLSLNRASQGSAVTSLGGRKFIAGISISAATVLLREPPPSRKAGRIAASR